MANIGIIGAGSWGIALAVLLHKNGHKITVWSILQDEIAMLEKEHEHKDKLPGVKLPKDMVFTTDLEGAVKGKDVLPKLRVQGGLHPGHVLPEDTAQTRVEFLPGDIGPVGPVPEHIQVVKREAGEVPEPLGKGAFSPAGTADDNRFLKHRKAFSRRGLSPTMRTAWE